MKVLNNSQRKAMFAKQVKNAKAGTMLEYDLKLGVMKVAKNQKSARLAEKKYKKELTKHLKHQDAINFGFKAGL